MEGIPKVDIAAYRSTASHTETTAGLIPAELHQVLGQSVTCAAGVTLLASIGAPAAPGAATGLTTVAAGGVKQAQTVDLTAGQTIAATVADKAGYSLSATGADLILKSSTFVVAIRDAINELATYGLTALNTLLVTTGIKAASIPAATLVANQHVIVDSGTVTTLTNAPADMALNSTVGKEATLTTIAGYIDTEIGTIITAVGTTIPNAIAALPTDADVNAACDTAVSDAGIPAATAALVLVTPAQKIVTNASGEVDANVQSVNDTALTGNGSALTPWGPV
jgi:hypothetical protein